MLTTRAFVVDEISRQAYADKCQLIELEKRT